MAGADLLDQERIQQLIREAPPWYKVPSLVKLYALLIAPLLTTAALGFDFSMTNGLQSVDVFMDNFDNPTGAKLGFYGASMSVGAMVGCLVGGFLSDKFGRKVLVGSGAIIVMGMVIMETFSHSLEMFAGAKMVLGFGIVIQQLGAPVLVTELAHPKQRETLTSICNTCISLGFIIGAWITFVTYEMNSQWAWKLPCLLQIVLPSFQAVLSWFCPESPRWLVSKGRLDEARALLVKYHGNGVEDEIVKAEFQEIVAGFEADKTVLKLNKEGIRSILLSKANRYRLWVIFVTAVGSQCLGIGFVGSYLPLVLDSVGMTSSHDKTLINGILSIWQWITALFGALIVSRVKRRSLFLVSTAGMLLSFSVWVALVATYEQSPSKGQGIGIVVVIFITSFFNSICWNPLLIKYTLEIITSKQRGFFFSFVMFTVNASGFCASYLNPVGLESISWRYYFV
ncbi:hypothetical protein PENSOL_c008G11534 [Penicillium solitum]|uniref:Major facilitator superfamily (MFS) profile domain-containing protein n=1 Tax=Penicillium solitum TaxID=60172 RepID=A0A1V6RBR0_9EURO|nr:uncharacterized protein PENSOL_c008G11534 [Penicillium solitum]OQD98849.1 hypothetical protein PENSOL_c008G11534 [Penicillium solitum]